MPASRSVDQQVTDIRYILTHLRAAHDHDRELLLTLVGVAALAPTDPGCCRPGDVPGCNPGAPRLAKIDHPFDMRARGLTVHLDVGKPGNIGKRCHDFLRLGSKR